MEHYDLYLNVPPKASCAHSFSDVAGSRVCADVVKDIILRRMVRCYN